MTIFTVTSNILTKFLFPILNSRFGNCRTNTFIVTMPKTSIYEYYFSSPNKNEVWRSWQFLDVKTVSVSHSMHKAADCHFGGSVFASYSAHDLTSPIGSDAIHSVFPLKLVDHLIPVLFFPKKTAAVEEVSFMRSEFANSFECHFSGNPLISFDVIKI